jgi:hypothetical protein
MATSIVETLLKLPPSPGITYRGMSGAPPTTSFTLASVLPTSLDPRVATENFASERVAAIATATGRFIGPLSRHPGEQEVALLPATLLMPVGSVAVAGLTNEVVLLAEAGAEQGLPADLPELKRVVIEQVADAMRRDPVAVASPGRFSPARQ